MIMSDETNEIFKAIFMMQSNLVHANKDSNNPFFKSKYADLTACIDAARPHLANNGLAVVQFPTIANNPDHCALTTMITHSSGQYVSNVMEMKPVKNDPQGIGSCITYMRRYAFAAAVGLGQQDDDGNAASGRQEKSKPADPVRKATLQTLSALAKKEGWNKEDIEAFAKTEWNKLSKEGAEEVIEHIKQGGAKA